MIAATRVVLDRALLWALVATWALTALAALVAAVAAWRAGRAARRTLARLEAIRSAVTRPQQFPDQATTAPWQEPGSEQTAPYRIEVERIPPDGPGTQPGAAVAGAAPAPPGPPRAEPFVAGPARRGAVPPPAVPTPAPPPGSPPPPEPPAAPRPPGHEPAEAAPWFVQSPASAEEIPARPSEEAVASARRRRLDDPDPFVRIEAIVELRGQPDVLEALLRAIQDDYPVVRRQAVRALREAGGNEATRALIDVANQDPSAEVREEAVVALASLLREARSDLG